MRGGDGLGLEKEWRECSESGPSSDKDGVVSVCVWGVLQSTKGKGRKQYRLKMFSHLPTLAGGAGEAICLDRSMPGLFHATYPGHLP